MGLSLQDGAVTVMKNPSRFSPSRSRRRFTLVRRVTSLRLLLLAGVSCLQVSCAAGRQVAEQPISSAPPSLSDRFNPFRRPQAIARLPTWATEALPQKVYLRGRVVRRSPLLSGIVYQLEDGTGEIWVQSHASDGLKPGVVVSLTGELVEREIVVEGQRFTERYVVEKQRFAAAPN